MDKDKLGNHFIDIGTIITDNLTGLKYQVVEITSTGLKQMQVTSITESKEVFTPFETIENAFAAGNISISGYEPTDLKILHLVIIDLKTSVKLKEDEYRDSLIPVTRNQLKKKGLVKIKKKVKKYLHPHYDMSV